MLLWCMPCHCLVPPTVVGGDSLLLLSCAAPCFHPMSSCWQQWFEVLLCVLLLLPAPCCPPLQTTLRADACRNGAAVIWGYVPPLMSLPPGPPLSSLSPLPLAVVTLPLQKGKVSKCRVLVQVIETPGGQIWVVCKSGRLIVQGENGEMSSRG